MPPGRKPGYKHMQETRDRIQAKLLVNRLTEHSLADKPIMDASQVNAAKGLLNKVLPDLKAVELSGDPDNPVGVSVIKIEVVDPHGGDN